MLTLFSGISPPHFKQREIFFVPLFHDSFAMPFTGSTVPPFLRYGVSRFSLPNTPPLTANEKDPSAPLGMTIREECVSHTLFLCMMHEISIPYTVISSAVEKSSLHSVLPCSFRKRFPILLCHTYNIIPSCKKDPSTSLGMMMQE